MDATYGTIVMDSEHHNYQSEVNIRMKSNEADKKTQSLQLFTLLTVFGKLGGVFINQKKQLRFNIRVIEF